MTRTRLPKPDKRVSLAAWSRFFTDCANRKPVKIEPRVYEQVGTYRERRQLTAPPQPQPDTDRAARLRAAALKAVATRRARLAAAQGVRS